MERVPPSEVVIPAYNAGEWLVGTVASALAVPGVVRVRVVDDGSTDPAAGVLGGITDDRLVVHRVANGGGQRARNHGIEAFLDAGDADWMICLDHDDLLTPGIAEAVKLGERTGAAGVIPDREEFDEHGWEERKFRPADLVAGEAFDPGLVHRPLAIFTATGLVLSRRVLEQGVRFDPRFVVADDNDVMRQAGAVGPLVICGEVGLRRRVFRDGRNLSSWRTLAGQAADFCLLHERWYDAKHADAWRDQGVWILNQIVKRGVRGESAERLAGLARECGWRVPVKTRWRLATHRLRGKSRSQETPT